MQNIKPAASKRRLYFSFNDSSRSKFLKLLEMVLSKSSEDTTTIFAFQPEELIISTYLGDKTTSYYQYKAIIGNPKNEVNVDTFLEYIVETSRGQIAVKIEHNHLVGFKDTLKNCVGGCYKYEFDAKKKDGSGKEHYFAFRSPLTSLPGSEVFLGSVFFEGLSADFPKIGLLEKEKFCQIFFNDPTKVTFILWFFEKNKETNNKILKISTEITEIVNEDEGLANVTFTTQSKNKICFKKVFFDPKYFDEQYSEIFVRQPEIFEIFNSFKSANNFSICLNENLECFLEFRFSNVVHEEQNYRFNPCTYISLNLIPREDYEL